MTMAKWGEWKFERMPAHCPKCGASWEGITAETVKGQPDMDAIVTFSCGHETRIPGRPAKP